MGGEYRLGYRPALTGLRGIAVLLVIAHHTSVPGLDGGGGGDVGVTLFLVLSGFLITRLLTEERESAGRVNLRAFYLRRVRRLAPALLLLLVVCTALGAPLYQVAASAGYVSDFLLASDVPLDWLRHTWTLSMEEQFYLIWPLVLLACLRFRRRPAVMLGVLIIAAELWRAILAWHGVTGARLAFGPDARATALLVGCLLAYVVRPVRWPSAVGAGAVLMALIATGSIGPYLFREPLAVAACAALVLWAATTTASLAWLVPVGTISYGMYLWQTPLVDWLTAASWPSWAIIVGTFSGSVGIAAMSWRWLEKPIINGDKHRADARPVVHAGLPGDRVNADVRGRPAGPRHRGRGRGGAVV